MWPDPDLALVVGLGLVLFSTLSLVAAWADRRRPWVGGAICGTGLCLVALAVFTSPQGYGLTDLPMVIFTVLGRYVL